MEGSFLECARNSQFLWCVGGCGQAQGAGTLAENWDCRFCCPVRRRGDTRKGFAEIGLHALAELIHPAELIFGVAVSLPRSFVKPGHGLAVVGLHSDAVLEQVAYVFLGVGVAVIGGFVKPGECFDLILRLAPALFGHVAELVFGAPVPGEALGVVASAYESALVGSSRLPVRRRRDSARRLCGRDRRPAGLKGRLPVLVKRNVHSFPLPETFVVRRLERNSRIKLVPTRPARPTAALVKTRFVPRFALG